MSVRAETARKPIERKKHLSVVERRLSSSSKKAKRSRKALVITVSLLLAGAIVMGVLLEQVLLAKSAFRVAELRKGMATAEARHEELLLEAARLDSATRIERYARQSLGMIEPAPGSVEYIVADVRTGQQIGQVSVRQGDRDATRVAPGFRSAAAYGESP